MIRIGASIVLGCLLLMLQSSIVMKLNGYENIMFLSSIGLLSVWLLNAVFSFSILTQIKPWITKRFGQAAEPEAEAE
jgi:hypothetical protein